MIHFTGYEQIIETVYKNRQEHVFEYWNELNDSEKINLLDELSDIDFTLMTKLYNQKSEDLNKKHDYMPSSYISIPVSEKEINDFNSAKSAGEKHIIDGKVAALLVAGGQGTRLGYDGPKGIFPIGPVSNSPLFQIHAEKLKKYSDKYKVSIPWLIMTSKSNHKDTINYFISENNFGINSEDIFFFSQNMIPSLDTYGNLILKNKNSLFMNPDGHGGTLTALYSSGLIPRLKERGIESVSYFQVDNPLVKIIDPTFIGFHILNNSDVSSKAVMKTGPEEKVGVFIEYKNHKYGIIEYSDMTPEEKEAVDSNGRLLFSMGNIAVHIFKLSYIETISSGRNISLPYHTARKNIKVFKDGTEKKIKGLKYEKFIFDALSFTEKNTIMETIREEEFAPVKNKNGVDSPDTAKKLISNLHRKWLTQKEINIPENVKVIEISPLIAVEAEDIPPDISIPDKEKVYID